MKTTEHVHFTKRIAVLVCRLAAASSETRRFSAERERVEAELCRLIGEETGRGLAAALLHSRPRCLTCGSTMDSGDGEQCMDCACATTLAWDEQG